MTCGMGTKIWVGEERVDPKKHDFVSSNATWVQITRGLIKFGVGASMKV